jgi:hypothetical protein
MTMMMTMMMMIRVLGSGGVKKREGGRERALERVLAIFDQRTTAAMMSQLIATRYFHLPNFCHEALDALLLLHQLSVLTANYR